MLYWKRFKDQHKIVHIFILVPVPVSYWAEKKLSCSGLKWQYAWHNQALLFSIPLYHFIGPGNNPVNSWFHPTLISCWISEILTTFYHNTCECNFLLTVTVINETLRWLGLNYVYPHFTGNVRLYLVKHVYNLSGLSVRNVIRKHEAPIINIPIAWQNFCQQPAFTCALEEQESSVWIECSWNWNSNGTAVRQPASAARRILSCIKWLLKRFL